MNRITMAAVYGLLCLALVVTTALVAAPAPNQAAPGAGVICVTSDPSGVTFSISGAASYSGTTPWAVANAPAGAYSITWENLLGYQTTPASENQTLAAGGAIVFDGVYSREVTAPQIGAIGVTSNLSGATFTIHGTASYNGTVPWAVADAPVGTYTIVWDNMTGYTTPDEQTRTLDEVSAITFNGAYRPIVAPVTTGTIGVTSVPTGAGFNLSGAASYNGTAPWAVADAPPGAYTIMWDNMTGFDNMTPASENKTLVAGRAISFEGIYSTNTTAPRVGTIGVTSNLSGASFSLSGAASYNGTVPWAKADAPAGSYTIVWDNMTGYTTPENREEDLSAGEAIVFHGDYMPVVTPPQSGTIGVTSNLSGASFTLSGAAGYKGTVPWAQAGATAGAYTIVWDNITGYTAPADRTENLTAGQAIAFFGVYRSMEAQSGTIGVTSVPTGATFKLSGATSFNGTAPWAKADAPAGLYTITWDNMTGFDNMTPASENKTLRAEGAITFQGIYSTNMTAPRVGTIGVNSNLSGATFTISGAASYNGTVPWAVADAPAGSYTIMWDNMTGYTRPANRTQNLTAGEAITFDGVYTAAPAPPTVGVIGVISNLDNATFTISGAASYNGTVPWAVDNATPGSYTITWDNMTGYDKPANRTETLAAGHAVIFDGVYTPAQVPPQPNSISVTSSPSGASFTITGAASYNGTTPWTVDNATPGSYTITWDNMTGYTTPPSVTQTLQAGSGIHFEGDYVSGVQPKWTYTFHDPTRGTTLYLNTAEKTFRFTSPSGFDSGVREATWMQVQTFSGERVHINMYYRGESFRVIVHAHVWQDFCETWVYRPHRVTLYRLVDPVGFE